ncbi:MAG TPA: helix-turn-helix domain-containing protein [Steroidobacteraceae bacterium]
MVQCTQARFDASFAALSDATRRGVLEQLGRADASITDLAAKFRVTLTGMRKHVGVLEQAGLVITQKIGRVRTCELGLRRLEEEAARIERYRQLSSVPSPGWRAECPRHSRNWMNCSSPWARAWNAREVDSPTPWATTCSKEG